MLYEHLAFAKAKTLDMLNKIYTHKDKMEMIILQIGFTTLFLIKLIMGQGFASLSRFLVPLD